MKKVGRTIRRTGGKRPGTSVNEVYRVLYDRIVAGDYPPHFKMSQKALAEEFRVSRTPLREALSRLQASEFLVADANRGMVVAPVRNTAAEEGYAARLLLEPPMVATMVGNFEPADLDEMAQALDEMKRSWERNREFQEAHLRFHMVALRRYPTVIRDIVLSLYDQSRRHQRLHFSRPRIPDDFIDIDRMYLDAIRAGDERKTGQILAFHLIDASIGIVLDIDPDYTPRSLIAAARGIGIEFENWGDRPLQRPLSIRWKAPSTSDILTLRTTNLICIDAMDQQLYP